jgi:hypothetical protein
MGYRSQVAYRIGFPDRKILNEFIALVMMKGGLEKEALSECQIELPDNGRVDCFINYYAGDVKWYPSYADVQAHTWLYKYAVERFPNDCAYAFIRIGEDRDDIEEEDDGVMNDVHDSITQDMYTVTTIEMPFSHNYEPIGDALSIVEVIPDTKT